MKKLNKEIILGAAIILLGVFSWYFLKYVFYIGNLTAGCWISGIILLIVWGISLCLVMLLVEDKRILYGSFIGSLIAFVFFFNNEPFYYLIVLAILFLAFWRASIKIKKEEKNQIRLNFWKIWKKGLPIFITAFILLVAIVFYLSPNLMAMKQIEIKIPRNIFDSIVKPVEGLIGEKLSKVVGFDRDTIYQSINSSVNDKLNPYKKFIPISLALGLFFGLKLISVIYVALVILLSWVVLKLLTTMGFTRTEKTQKEVETIKL